MNFPDLMNKNGIGAHASVIKVIKVVAQMSPRLTNINAPKRGKAQPKNKLRMAFAAHADAANGL